MLLEVDGLSAFYGDLCALQNVCVHIDTGESVALVGANGAGKTTFLRCLAGLIDRKSGSIRFNGSDTARRAAEDIARLGIVLAPEGIKLRLASREGMKRRLVRHHQACMGSMTRNQCNELETRYPKAPRR